MPRTSPYPAHLIPIVVGQRELRFAYVITKVINETDSVVGVVYNRSGTDVHMRPQFLQIVNHNF